MNYAGAEKVAAALLYEGYILYPYRPSAIKNRQRWNFGTLYPRVYAEAQHPQEDVLRQTASIAYHHRWHSDSLNALALWGRNHTIDSPTNANGYLFEATAQLHDRHSIWTRIENVDRTTDLLGASAPPEETVVGRVQAFTGGYAHHLYSNHWSTYELGAQGTLYNTPLPLRTLYGDHPAGVAAVLNIHLGN